jgi:ankyrin repeat protein
MALAAKFWKPAKPDELCRAVMGGDEAAVKKLLSGTRFALDKTYGSYTVLAYAAGGYGAFRGSTEMVRGLLDSGAKVDAAGEDGTTALMRAATANRADVTNMLIGAGASVNQKDRNDMTALMLALLCHCEKSAEALILKRAEVEGRGTHGNCPGFSPLMLAVQGQMHHIVAMLMERGARLEPTNDKGQTALDLARGDKPMLELLNARNNGKPRVGVSFAL